MKQERMTLEEARAQGLINSPVEAASSHRASQRYAGRKTPQATKNAPQNGVQRAAPKPTRHSLLIQDATATYAPTEHRPGTLVWASSLGIFLGTAAQYGEPTVLLHYCWKVGGWKTAFFSTEQAALKAASLEQWEQSP